MPRVRRQSVTFTNKAAETVERLAQDAGTSVSEVVREAVAREAWFQGTVRSGKQIFVRDPVTGEQHQVEFVG
jgi:hypothetical protein